MKTTEETRKVILTTMMMHVGQYLRLTGRSDHRDNIINVVCSAAKTRQLCDIPNDELRMIVWGFRSLCSGKLGRDIRLSNFSSECLVKELRARNIKVSAVIEL